MNAHDVRRLRVCDVCNRLVDKDAVLDRYGNLCGACAVRRAGSIRAFVLAYPMEQWGRLTIGDIGAANMKKLLAYYQRARSEPKAR